MFKFIFVTIILLVISFIFDKQKTRLAISNGFAMFKDVLPRVLNTLAVISVVLWLIPRETIARFLGMHSGVTGFLIAAFVGSVILMPAFISFPLAAMLLHSGASYSVVAVFLSTLMMVGVVTLPIEAKYLGWRMAVIRNIFGFVGAVVVGILMSFVFR